MKDYTVRRYTFEELSEGAKKKAVEGMRNFLLKVLDSASTSEYLTECVSTAIRNAGSVFTITGKWDIPAGVVEELALQETQYDLLKWADYEVTLEGESK